MIRLWHAVVAALAAFGLVGQTILSVDEDRSLVNLFSYFTIQSNILMLIASVLIVLNPERGGKAFGILRLAGLVGITVTGVVYGIILAGNATFEGVEWWYDKVFHYVVPIMSVLVYLLFKPRTRFDKSALWFIAWPLAWLAYTLIRAEVSEPVYTLTATKKGPVPYDFLDIADHGGVFVTIACLVVTVLALGIASGYIKLSQRDAGSAAA
ncbi:MAG: Pr6Pr family membrane protein [Aeromicrobium sp.]